jgi:hypothetical protein
MGHSSRTFHSRIRSRRDIDLVDTDHDTLSSDNSEVEEEQEVDLVWVILLQVENLVKSSISNTFQFQLYVYG